MSVADYLGLDTPDTNELIVQARQRWPVWCVSDPRLSVVSDPVDLQDWTRTVRTGLADDALHALAATAAQDGGDDRAAAMTLCWSLLPAACAVANQLSTLTVHIDSVVASQLWVEARTFPWRRLRKVAANIKGNTRAAVLRQWGPCPRRRESDRTWDLTLLVDPTTTQLLTGPATYAFGAHEPTAAEELGQVLAWACRRDVISTEDQALLLCLVEAAGRNEVSHSGRGSGGLLANDLSEQVGERLGVSHRTVRRRARRSLSALAEACRHGRYEASA